ncbi:MAG: hypothetical protein ACLFMM_06530 [Methanohalobium sp.]|uniref:hypothetical protein n=1 Tax=Methanohalobium sp. TaxID=2837493 RepID=UPI0039782121
MDFLIAFAIGILIFLVIVAFTAIFLKMQSDLKAKKPNRDKSMEKSSPEDDASDGLE